MKKLWGAVLLSSVLLIGCAASIDDAAEAGVKIVPEVCDVADNSWAYSADRSSESAGDAAGDPAAAAGAVRIAAEPMVYVTFSSFSDSVTAEDGTTLFITQGVTPLFTVPDLTCSQWLASTVETASAPVRDEILQMEDNAKMDYETWDPSLQSDFYARSYYSGISAERLDTKIASVLHSVSVYWGGAHPNYAQIAYNADLSECRLLGLDDILEENGVQVLRDGVLDELAVRFADLDGTGLYPDYEMIVDSCFNQGSLTENWYFNKTGLIVYFNCYEIAPHAAGIIKVEFPYGILDGVLKPQYYPEEPIPGEGSAVLMDEPGTRSVISVADDANDGVYIGCDQTIHHVRLYQLSSWITEDMPVVGQMVFASNRLTGEEVLRVCKPSADGRPELLLVYTDGAGKPHTLAIGHDNLYEISAIVAE